MIDKNKHEEEAEESKKMNGRDLDRRIDMKKYSV